MESPDTVGRHMTDQVKKAAPAPQSGEAKIAAPKPPAGEERRKHRRKKCILPARLVTAAGSHDCRVLDLSQDGAKIESSEILTLEQPVTLVAEPIGTFTGVVAWCGDGCFGMRFVDQQAGAPRAGAESRDAGPRAADTPVLHPGSDMDTRSQIPRAATAPQAAPAPERSFILCHGDIICVLRKRQALKDTEKAVFGDPTNCKLVEIDAHDLTELAKQESAVTVAFLRVAPLG